MMEELCVWSPVLATGLEEMDAEHQRLFEHMNSIQLSMQVEPSLTNAHVQLNQLVETILLHHQQEDALLQKEGLDPQSQQESQEEHHVFTQQIHRALAQMTDPSREDIDCLMDYIAIWLTSHILDMDQRLASELLFIRQGRPADVARAEASQQLRVPLPFAKALRALHGRYIKAQEQLFERSLDLEQQVAVRTADVLAAQIQLKADNAQLQDLFQRLERTQTQLLQSEKLAAIGQLAAGVAHEINNPVGFVSSNLGSLHQYAQSLLQLVEAYEVCEAKVIPEGAEKDRLRAIKVQMDLPYLRQDILSLIQESMEGLERVKKIVQDLKDFSRVGASEWQEVDLLQGLESTINVAWNELKYKAEIDRQLVALPPVRCVPAQINQVFMNLLVNAAHALVGRGKITLRSGVENDQAWIEIEDTGAGMSEAVLSRIFEPFFTTKPAGQGTGLGLPLSLEIVHKHGGEITVQSSPGKGSCFRVSLPVHGVSPVEDGHELSGKQ